MVFVCFIVSLGIYYPFFKAFEKIQLAQENQQEEKKEQSTLNDAITAE